MRDWIPLKGGWTSLQGLNTFYSSGLNPKWNGMKGPKLKRSRGIIPNQKCSHSEMYLSKHPKQAHFQRLVPGVCHVESCWQTLNRGCKLWVSQRAIRRERQEICRSVINASEKSEQRVTSPQLITTRGKGRTNRYPDPVIHICLASIVLLARLPRMSVIPMACFGLCSCQALVRPDSHIF